MVNRPAVPDGSEVLTGLEADTRPVARLTYVDADELYLSWVWDHAPAHPRMVVLPRAHIAPGLDQLRAALPSPLPSETGLQALERALGGGDFTDPAREQRLATALTSCVIPQRLGLELNALEACGLRPHLRIQPSPSIAQLPWELLGTSGTDRLIDMVDVSTLLPASLRNGTGRAVSAWDPRGAVVTALDPAVPGFAATSELGSVLGPVEPGSPLAEMVAALGDRARPGGKSFRRNDFGRDRLAAELAGASRFLYVGHVTASTHALDSRMHLSDGAGTTGHAEPVNGHRPFTAADVVLGHGSAKPLRAPNRVALVACESGGDLRFAEPTGLVAAFTHRGAEYVTATRWTLPTEAGLRRYVPGLGDRAEGVLAEAILAVNAAHESTDPVAALSAWQRAQAHRWIETGDPRCTPLIWAAFHTAWSPPPPEVDLRWR